MKQRTKLSEQDKAHVSKKVTRVSDGNRREHVISFRITSAQYEELTKRCTNSYGEKIMTQNEYARYATLNLSLVRPSKLHHERYRLAIAAQMTNALYDLSLRIFNIKYPINGVNNSLMLSDCEELLKIKELLNQLLNNN